MNTFKRTMSSLTTAFAYLVATGLSLSFLGFAAHIIFACVKFGWKLVG